MNGIIFGCGKYGHELARGLKKYYGINILALTDNDVEKWGYNR